MAKLLVIGGTGFLGRRLTEIGTRRGFDVSATHHTTAPPHSTNDPSSAVAWSRCDITNRSHVDDVVSLHAPTVVINAAYIQSGPTASVVCGEASGWIAAAAQRAGARFVHVSTDLVFDGTLGRPYTEADETNPLSEYGHAKLRGEGLVLAEAPGTAIARTSLIYGDPTAPQERLTHKALDSDSISFFTDELRSPIHVDDLATALLDIAALEFAGVLNVAGAERLSRFEFAHALAEHAGHDPSRLTGTPQDPALGPRPKDVSLDISNAVALGLSLPGATQRLANN